VVDRVPVGLVLAKDGANRRKKGEPPAKRRGSHAG
jgi:hypothetical protein